MCRWIVRIFAALYLLALLVLLIGTYGLFGQERDPLSGVFLVPLGLPWNQFIDAAPAALLPWLAALAPLVNLLLLRAICRAFSNRRAD